MQTRLFPALPPGNVPKQGSIAGRTALQTHFANGHPEPVTASEFVGAMRGAATGVNVVTTDGAAGRFGVTVSAFSSVSAEPPMVLVCINRRSPAAPALVDNGCFAVNVLSSSQQHVAENFAGNPDSTNRYDFAAACWTRSVTGAPLLRDSVAGFDCVLATVIDAGTHRIFIGRVAGVTSAATQPLLYSNRMYGRMAR